MLQSFAKYHPQNMDRMDEFLRFVDSSSQHEYRNDKKAFYNSFNESILSLGARVSRTSSLKSLLVLEKEFLALQKQIGSIFEASQLEGTPDILAHYEGIKQILNIRLLQLSKNIEAAKKQICELDVDLSPERPVVFRDVVPGGVLEQENRKIVEHQDYEVVRQRLQRIDVIQKAINENLLVQDERIDNICRVTGGTSKVYGDINEGIDFDSGSFMRRAVFVVLLCLSFVLLFLHFFYK